MNEGPEKGIIKEFGARVIKPLKLHCALMVDLSATSVTKEELIVILKAAKYQLQTMLELLALYDKFSITSEAQQLRAYVIKVLMSFYAPCVHLNAVTEYDKEFNDIVIKVSNYDRKKI